MPEGECSAASPSTTATTSAAATTRRSPSSAATRTRRPAPGAARKDSRAATEPARARGTASATARSIRRPAPATARRTRSAASCAARSTRRATTVNVFGATTTTGAGRTAAAGSVCRNKARSLCCVKTWKPCEPGAGGVVKCCPPSDHCCFNKNDEVGYLLRQRPRLQRRCLRLRQGDEEVRQGVLQGDRGLHEGKVLREGQVQLRRRTLLRRQETLLRQDLCDSKAGKCIGGSCCPPNRLLGKGASAKCCPTGTVVSSGGVCCPKADPNCCSEDELSVLCPKGQTCVRGACKKL